jgi:AcrR family transcriptional regulator
MLTLQRKGSEYHHGDLKTAAIVAGRALIESGGLSALGIRRVAEKIGVTAPALYRHFASLKELLEEITCQVRQELGEFMLERRKGVRKSRDNKRYELEKFQAMGDAYIDYADKHPRLFEIAFIHHHEKSTHEYSDLAWQLLNESIENFIALGMTPKAKRNSAPLVAWSAVHGVATLIANRSVIPSEIKFFRTAVINGVQDALLEK